MGGSEGKSTATTGHAAARHTTTGESTAQPAHHLLHAATLHLLHHLLHLGELFEQLVHILHLGTRAGGDAAFS